MVVSEAEFDALVERAFETCQRSIVTHLADLALAPSLTPRAKSLPR